ncbi:MAG: RadC family protein [Bacilli bacterium]
MSFKAIPTPLQPREKAIKYGIESLSEIELLAIFLRSGTSSNNVIALASNIIEYTGGLNNIASFSIEELMQIDGIGPVKALELKVLRALVDIINECDISKYQYINNPKSIFKLFQNKLSTLKQEHFIVICLNAKNAIICYKTIYIGSLSSSIVHPREVFNYIISNSASSFLCLHNHPSGDPMPSQNDIEITKAIDQLALLCGIPLLDHIIIGEQNYFSLKENNII